MERVLIKEIDKEKEKEVKIQGRIEKIRSLGGLIFILISDRTGTIQTVWEKEYGSIGDIVEIEGTVKEEKRAPEGYEIKGKKIEVISKNEFEWPFDLSKKDINLHLYPQKIWKDTQSQS